MNKLTPFARFLIMLVILGAIFFGGKYILENTSWGKNMLAKSTTEQTDAETKSEPQHNLGAPMEPNQNQT